MLNKTNYTVSNDTMQEALAHLPGTDFRVSLNKPTGEFFYDPWEIKDEYKGTAWDKLLAVLPPIGEARVIQLDHSKCYQCHADIDDRYHLNLSGSHSYLVDLTNNELTLLQTDATWYTMDTGRLHSAVNFGRTVRTQLVVRHLLTRNTLAAPKNVKLTPINMPSLDTARFVFDNTVSPWLNYANKRGVITNFAYSPKEVTFTVDESAIASLEEATATHFNVEFLSN